MPQAAATPAAPPKAAPVAWQTTFQDLDAWEAVGPEQMDLLRPEAGRALVVAPRLVPPQTFRLTLRQPLTLHPRHRYRLLLDLHMAPFTRRRVAVLLEQANGASLSLPLRPVRHSGELDPPPAWVTETSAFITPAGAPRARIQCEFEAVGDNHGLPLAMGRILLEDHGPVSMASGPGPNLQHNPGVEEIREDVWPAGVRHEDAAAAHTGQACARYAGPGRTIVDLGGTFISPPVLVQFRAWVRGAGRFIPECRRSGPGYERLTGLRGPEFALTQDWREVVWEVGIPDSQPETVTFHFVADIFRSGTVFLDDVDIRILSADGIRHH
jgi:hypothetical protein